MTKIDKLIAQHRNKIASLEKRVNIALEKIHDAEDKIETTLGEKYCRLSEECASYRRGLDRLMIEKRRERNAGK